MPTTKAELCNCLERVAQNFPTGAPDVEWTVAVLYEFRDLGIKNGWKVCPGGRGDMDRQGEWLYDMVWYRSDNEDRLRHVELVLESEWAKPRGKIKEDFEKLLVARCPWKIMVYTKTPRDDLAYLRQGIQLFERIDQTETYLLARFNEETWRFDCEAFP